MLGETSDGEFNLLRIREFDNDDVDDKTDSTDEDIPPNFSINWPMSCAAHMKQTLVASDEIQVNVMQKSVV